MTGELPRSDDVPHPQTGLLKRGRPVFNAAVRRYWDLQVRGDEHLPTTGPVILVANHMGWLDGPLMAIFTPRPVHALTKTEMFAGPLGRVLTAAGQIPVHRFGYDPLAVRTSLRVLREGGVVGVFPEGTRGDGSVSTALGGSAYLALVTGAPVVPLVFLGTREYGGTHSSLPPRGSRLVMTYGAPRTWPRQDWPRRKQDVRTVAEEHRTLLVETLHEAMAATGIPLPGPIPALPTDLKDPS